MPAAYRVYILQNHAGKFYIGLSNDVARRVAQHNTGQSRWTEGQGHWTIVWQSEEWLLTDARKLENRLKRQGRGKGFYAITGLQRGSS
jgi:predicted GIY-YIG superfamily endonuclease